MPNHLIITDSYIAAIQRVSLACGNEPRRPQLHSLVITPDGPRGVVFSATNGEVLAFVCCAADAHGLTEPVYLRSDAVKALRKLKPGRRGSNCAILLDSDQEGKFSVTLREGSAVITLPAYTDESYLNWKKVLPIADLRHPEKIRFNTHIEALGTAILTPDGKGSSDYSFALHCLTSGGSETGCAVAENLGVFLVAMPVLATPTTEEYIAHLSAVLGRVARA